MDYNQLWWSLFKLIDPSLQIGIQIPNEWMINWIICIYVLNTFLCRRSPRFPQCFLFWYKSLLLSISLLVTLHKVYNLLCYWSTYYSPPSLHLTALRTFQGTAKQGWRSGHLFTCILKAILSAPSAPASLKSLWNITWLHLVRAMVFSLLSQKFLVCKALYEMVSSFHLTN